MLKNFFKPTPMTFRERRELIKRIWANNGYKKRPEPYSRFISIAEKVNQLVYSL